MGVVGVGAGCLGLLAGLLRGVAGALPTALLQAGCGVQKDKCWADSLDVLTHTERRSWLHVDGGGEVRTHDVLHRVRLIALSGDGATPMPPLREPLPNVMWWQCWFGGDDARRQAGIIRRPAPADCPCRFGDRPTCNHGRFGSATSTDGQLQTPANCDDARQNLRAQVFSTKIQRRAGKSPA